MIRALIRETLPPEQRLALAYAPAQHRDALLAALGLDVRLAQVVTGAREPLLGQIRLAWWHERLADDADPVAGEPLIELLHAAGTERQSLRALVDAWEGLLGDESAETLDSLAAARARALCQAAPEAASDPGAATAAREWALHDLSRIPGPWGDHAARLADAEAWRAPRLPRSQRSLAVLHALARRRRTIGRAGSDPWSILVAVRVGLFGR